eukprot:5379314-Pyramimonas_sp.AAC.1
MRRARASRFNGVASAALSVSPEEPLDCATTGPLGHWATGPLCHWATVQVRGAGGVERRRRCSGHG